MYERIVRDISLIFNEFKDAPLLFLFNYYISFKSWLFCCSLPSVALQQKVIMPNTHTSCDQKALPCKHWIKGSVTLFYEPFAKDFSQSTEAILYKKQTATYFRGPRSGSFVLPMKDTLTCSAWITETNFLFRAADIPVAFKTIQPQNHNDDEYENHEFHVFNYPQHYPASVASLLNRSSSAALGYLSNEVLLLRIFMLRLPEIYECLIFT